MTSGGHPIERLRAFLRELNPAARNLLIKELERSLVSGEEMPGAELVLQELRRSMRDTSQTLPRFGHAARLFFKPLEPFLVDDAADHKHRGRIARVALEPIWNWVCRDLLGDIAKNHCKAIDDAVAADDNAKAEQLTRTFQDQTVAKINE